MSANSQSSHLQGLVGLLKEKIQGMSEDTNPIEVNIRLADVVLSWKESFTPTQQDKGLNDAINEILATLNAGMTSDVEAARHSLRMLKAQVNMYNALLK